MIKLKACDLWLRAKVLLGRATACDEVPVAMTMDANQAISHELNLSPTLRSS